MANRASSGTRTTGTTPPAGPRDCFRRRGRDVGAQDRRRVLQVARAEGLACRSAADALRRDMEDERGRLDAAVCEYERRKAALVGRQADAHERLSRVLRDRSAAELAAEAVRERAENELKARRTAGTVRAYRLNARWRQLHGRYRGFVVDVLRPQSGGGGGAGGGGSGGGGGGGDGDDGDSDGGPAASRSANAPPPPAARTGTNRRFFAVADRVGTQNRRESLRTTRSLHALMVGYLRETTSAGDTAATVARPSRQRGRSIAVLDGAGPERVLDKLRAVQEQGARIAERVRRRAGPSLAGGAPSAADDKRRRSDVLCAARDRVSAGREYVDRVRGYADEAAAALDARPEQLELRGRLLRACEACEPRNAGPRRAAGGGSLSGGTAVEIAARLERACFELFGRLDRVGADARRRHAQSGTRSELGDVVAVCLRTVQKQRADTARQARDVARRVNDFRKAVDRLLSAASPGRTTVARHKAQNAATGRPPPPARTPIRRTDDKTRPIAAPRKVSTAESVAVSANVTLLCPPSIRIVGYEQDCIQK